MNRTIKSGFLAGAFLVGMASCTKNNLVVDADNLLTPPATAKFNTAATTGTYYVAATGTPYKIPVGVSNVSDKDRVINLTYVSTSGAAAGVQYNAPATITIPAGKALDTLYINGIFSGYPTSTRVDDLKITISGGDIPASDYNKEFTLTLRKYCNVVLADLEGLYDNTNEYTAAGGFNYGPYTTAVHSLTSTGATTATGYISNIYDWGWSDIQVTLDWTDPGNFKVTIPQQLTNGGGATYVRSTAGKTNTFSSCNQTFSLSIDLLDAAQAVTSTGYQIRLNR